MDTLQMAEHNEIQGSHQPADFDTTPQTQQPISLTTLPNEILAAIIELLLPEGVRTTISKQSYPYFWTAKASLQKHGDPKAGSAPGNARKWSFLYVNQRFHAEALRYFHNRRYIIDITEKSLCQTRGNPMEASFRRVRWSSFPLSQADLNHEATSTCAAFPGLILGQVKELMVHIHPTDLGTFWHRLNNALDSLCRQLIQRGPIKSLTIDLQDTSYSELWWFETAETFCLSSADGVGFEYYENVLRNFEQVIASSGQCEIHLPYWMERCWEKHRLLQRYVGKFGARVFFSPAPMSPKDEVSDRDRHDLVALPDGYMPLIES